ncbi:hypothetical protein Cfla_3252 [Cellulomonas flavigena DSM 20109]|uniref:Uncharacterized protein n=1 Tax=Cellulomonas flavigena (strain ATCC 482 / DSM 20109 / BCRC 11376 / JCM 18109 / NBRC 3775 / NCIMB 8073 / NRS 134) TaxID=446466 RepID=D5UBX4_CELFN|nr:hypothetical protein [Cellulomonas flavigena]ADG76133.1 hypothetical protein Cfla_3252 [Cellulomonas flavigena DSM 20109]
MTPNIPPEVRGLVDEAGGSIEIRGNAVRIDFGDTGLQVREDDGRFLVEAIERGTVEGVDLETSSRAALERLLVVSCGATWRSRRRLGTLQPPSRRSTAPDTRLQPDGPVWVLEWQESGEMQRAVFWSQWDARAVAQALAADLGDVAAAVRRADGRPLYVVA